MIKKSIFQESIPVFNRCVPNNRTSKDMRQKLNEPQVEIDKSVVIVGNLNIPSVMDRSSRQKMCKNIVELNSTISTRSN